MTQQCEEASTEFVIPNLNFVIITTSYDKGFVEVEINTTDGSIVFFKTVDDCADAVIPSEIMLLQ